MTKQSANNSFANQSPALGVGRGPAFRGGFLNFVPEADQLRDDFCAAERQTPIKQQGETGSQFYLIFESPSLSGGVRWGERNFEQIIALSCEPEYAGAIKSPIEFRQDRVDEICTHIGATHGNQENAVLILHIDGVEFVDFIAPARFRLTFLNSDPDLFRGQLYKSAAQNIFFVVAPVNGELDVVSPSGVRADDREIGVVENRSQIVQSVAEGERDYTWDGFFSFNRQGQVAAFWIKTPDQVKGALIKEGADLPVQIIDMLIRAK